jgi:hypothetical protein
MPTTAAYLTTCRTAIAASPELTAFRTAIALIAGTRTNRARYWWLAYNDAQAGMSPAYRLRKSIRDTVNANADATISLTERESAYQSFVLEFAPTMTRPMDAAQEQAELERLLIEDQLS